MCRSPSNITDNNTAETQHKFEALANQSEEGGEEDDELPEELSRLMDRESKSMLPPQEAIEIINLGTDEEPKNIKIGATLNEDVRTTLVKLLNDYVEIFAWSYRDMPGLDTDIVVHRLPLKEGCTLVRQKHRRVRPDMDDKIREEVLKLFDAGFLAVVEYPPWIANIVPVPKKDGK